MMNGILFVQMMVKTFELCDLPVRVAKFVARKHWLIAGAVSTELVSIMCVLKLQVMSVSFHFNMCNEK